MGASDDFDAWARISPSKSFQNCARIRHLLVAESRGRVPAEFSLITQRR